ncbi:polysaccharide deacetylase family protein (plasmid) [Rhizobium sp. WW22]|uniref:polysaccharide deacetylase family protein n=1 Tax=Rhizobium sp. WW22 TaxID=3389070 RepID=UPI00399C3604
MCQFAATIRGAAGLGALNHRRNAVLRWLLAGILAAACAVSARAADGTIFLTFDDGPLPGTKNILSVLSQENVPAAMFMVGQHVETIPAGRDLLAEAKAMPLVTVGNHSYSHANNRYRRYYSNTQAVVADMLHANEVLGLTPIVNARLPGRDVFRLPTDRGRIYPSTLPNGSANGWITSSSPKRDSISTAGISSGYTATTASRFNRWIISSMRSIIFSSTVVSRSAAR